MIFSQKNIAYTVITYIIMYNFYKYIFIIIYKKYINIYIAYSF